MLKTQVELDVRVCQCGGLFAVPQWVYVNNFECPMCAKRRREALQIDITRYRGDIEHLRRSNAALRGALKRKRGRK